VQTFSELLGVKNEACTTAHEGFYKDILPLPSCSFASFSDFQHTWLMWCELCECVGGEREQPLPEWMSAWLCLLLCGLNGLYLRAGHRPLPQRWRRVQAAAALGLAQHLRSFFSLSPAPPSLADFRAEMTSHRVSYSGEPVALAEDMHWSQLEPALPPLGAAASVDVLGLVDPFLQACLRNPHDCLLPPSQWPSQVPRAKIWATPSEWTVIVAGLLTRGIVTPIADSDIWHVKGQKVLNGAFAVPKVSGNGERKQRLIMNLVPSNAYQRELAGDINSLPTPGQWQNIILEPGEELRWSSLDLRCCFYIYRLPECWRGFFTFAQKVWGPDVGLPNLGWTHVAATVVPVGWISACGIVQQVHRNLLLMPRALSAALPADAEITRDNPLPPPLVGACEPAACRRAWQVYIDNLDVIEVQSMLADLPPERADWIKTALATYAHHGVPVSDDKEEVRGVQVKALGTAVVGNAPWLLCPADALATAWDLALECLARPCTKHDLQIVLGKLVRVLLWRRPLMAVLDASWTCLSHWEGSRPVPATLRSELLLALVLTPLAVTDLATPVSPLVTASDASLTGGAVSHSHALSPRAPPSLPLLTAGRVPGIVIEIGDTVGALRLAMEAYNFQTLGHAYATASPEAARVVSYTFPDAMALPASVSDMWWWCQQHGRAEVIAVLLCNNFDAWLPPLLALLHFLPAQVQWEVFLQSQSSTQPLALAQYNGASQWKPGSWLHAFSSRMRPALPVEALSFTDPPPTDAAGLELWGGFPDRHTLTAMPTGARKQQCAVLELRRRCLLLRAVPVRVLKSLLAVCYPTAASHSVAHVALTPLSVVKMAIAGTTHRGSDVRLDIGTLMRPLVWPRKPLRVDWWLWQTAFTWQWERESHITDLELRAASTALHWRFRKNSSFPARFLHLVDNQSALGVLAKGRSSSHLLQVSLCRVAALLLLTRSYGHYGYVDTDSNPADAGSRQHAAAAPKSRSADQGTETATTTTTGALGELAPSTSHP